MQASEKYLARFPDIKNEKRRTYAAMVSAVDDGVGLVLATLREQGVEENTLVVFLSDNGGPTSANASDNQPLRGEKGSPWEGGFRVPFAMQWPKKIPKGTVYQKPVTALDIFATITAEAGVPANPEHPLDGVNLLPYLTGKNTGTPHEAIYLRMFDKGAYTVRSGDTKLIIEGTGKAPELYDLKADIGEEKNLALSRKEELAALEKMRVAWDAQLIPPVFEGLKMKPKAKGKDDSAEDP
jgi:arylsulfatase A-like enzyme